MTAPGSHGGSAPVDVRAMGAIDRVAWLEMRNALWPGEPSHARWIDEILAGESAWGFMAETPAGEPVGFAEVAIRAYANGCVTHPVAFLEGIWVKAEFRRRGIGATLMGHAAAFVARLGFRELGSDSSIDNHPSHAAHLRECESFRLLAFSGVVSP
jgi:aminoglycoside 6'-N-acetyltransferase I